MVAESHVVEGRQFRTKADYEAALRDKEKIDAIRGRYNLNNSADVHKLYAQLKAGEYRFESMVGTDFDDQIYEMIEKYKRQGSQGKGKGQRNKDRKPNDKRTANNRRTKQTRISLEDFDEEMQKEITAQLKARDRRRRFFITICSLGAVLCFGYFVYYYHLSEQTSADYEELAGLKNSEVLASEPEEKKIIIRGEMEEIVLPDVMDEYKTLYNKNKKLIGWLKIDDTIIDYPVMQTSNNDYYLDHNFNQEKDKNGSIFMDAECVAYPRSQNLILYGHHMKSGKMFGDLEKYARESYYKEHSIIQFDTIYEKSVYQVMYVFRTKVLKENEIAFKYYQFIDAGSAEEFNSYMNEMSQMSLYDTGVTAQYGDELLTLSTCDHSQTDGRFVVVAKRIQ